MQNNVTEITQKLLSALDDDYNVTNMAVIINVITILERTTITKEMLETTRLGKHVNEMRKHITDEAVAKRAKLLVKKWRSFLNPVESVAAHHAATLTTNGDLHRNAHPFASVVTSEFASSNNKKRPSSRIGMDLPFAKKQRANGAVSASAFDYDFSDNSNSSFKDVHVPNVPNKPLVVVNSDSNSSTQDALTRDQNSTMCDEQPKKRGRKKGSKNHKNLIEEAESSFYNKMVVSRGNAKVKTTQELIESLQNRSQAPATVAPLTSPANNIEDWRERAAKLTERVSLIDQKLNSGHRLKKHRSGSSNNNKDNNTNVISPAKKFEAPSEEEEDDEIIIVDDGPKEVISLTELEPSTGSLLDVAANSQMIPSLSIEEALSRLPPIDMSMLHTDEDEEKSCFCVLEESSDENNPTPKFNVHPDCPARLHLVEKYRLNDINDERVDLLHDRCIDHLNGNLSWRSKLENPEEQLVRQEAEDERIGAADVENVNIVPNFYDLPAKEACSENYKKYSISEDREKRKKSVNCNSGLVDYDNNSSDNNCTKETFRELHECCDRPSYNGDTLRILPYVIID